MTVQYATDDFAQSPAFNAFAAQEPDVAQWLVEKRKTFDFACSLLNAVLKFGGLTFAQLNAAKKCAAKSKAFAKDAAEAQKNAVAVNVEPIIAAFEKATKSGLKRPKLRFDGFEATLAGKNSKNAGAIYLKGKKAKTNFAPRIWGYQAADQSDDVYFGKVQNGKFVASFACTYGDKAKIEAALADPLAAAVAYGKRYGACSCCAKPLTNPLSVELGIGPICRAKYGL